MGRWCFLSDTSRTIRTTATFWCSASIRGKVGRKSLACLQSELALTRACVKFGPECCLLSIVCTRRGREPTKPDHKTVGQTVTVTRRPAAQDCLRRRDV